MFFNFINKYFSIFRANFKFPLSKQYKYIITLEKFNFNSDRCKSIAIEGVFMKTFLKIFLIIFLEI